MYRPRNWRHRGSDPSVLHGMSASPGRASGPVYRLGTRIGPPAAEPLLEDDRADAAIRMADAAIDHVAQFYAARAERSDGEARDILEAGAMIASDPAFREDVHLRLVRDRVPAPRAVWDAANGLAEVLAADEYMSERRRDVFDVRDRVVSLLTDRDLAHLPEVPRPYILLADDLSPADAAQLDPHSILALLTEQGGTMSHTAILARSLGIPAIVSLQGAAVLRDGTEVAVDATTGVVVRDPGPDAPLRPSPAPLPHTRAPLSLSDGSPGTLLANVSSLEEATLAAESGAAGIGLLRTEFLFLERQSAPGVEEQADRYAAIFDLFAGRRVIVRTLDAGADRSLPFLHEQTEPNPALGMRGLRNSYLRPDIYSAQLEAIALASSRSPADVWVMAPMVATTWECSEFVGTCHAAGLGAAGVLVEVPSAALKAERLADPEDGGAAFLSVGTNDLAQYTTAADRQLGDLADLASGWEPAVLDLVAMTAAGGRRHGVPVSVCGEIASDPAYAAVLVGLGVSSLSMTPRALAPVAAVLSTLTMEQCWAFAERARAAASALSARRIVRSSIPAIERFGL